MNGWRFEWFAGWKTFLDPALQAAWKADAELAATRIFQHPWVVRAWIDTRGAARELEPELCRATHEDGSRVWLPMVRSRRRARRLGLRELEAAGEPNFDYQEPLACRPDAGRIGWRDFWRSLEEDVVGGRRADVVRLRRVPAESSGEHGRGDESYVSPFLSLRDVESWSQLERTLSANLRGDLRRRFRRLAETGRHLELRRLGPEDLDEPDRELEALLTAHRREWAGTPSESSLEQAGMRAFYRRLLSALLPTGLLHFTVLRLDGETVAWHFGFLWRGTLHWYKPVYEVRHRELSPGKLLLGRLVSMAVDAGISEIDFGVGNEPYKLQWTQSSRSLRDIEIEVDTPIARLRRAARAMRARG